MFIILKYMGNVKYKIQKMTPNFGRHLYIHYLYTYYVHYLDFTIVLAPLTSTQPCFKRASASFIRISSSVIEDEMSLFASASPFASVFLISASFLALMSLVSASTFAVSGQLQSRDRLRVQGIRGVQREEEHQARLRHV